MPLIVANPSSVKNLYAQISDDETTLRPDDDFFRAHRCTYGILDTAQGYRAAFMAAALPVALVAAAPYLTRTRYRHESRFNRPG